MATSGCLYAQVNSFAPHHANTTLPSIFQSGIRKMKLGQRICISVNNKPHFETIAISSCLAGQPAVAIPSAGPVSVQSEPLAESRMASVTWGGVGVDRENSGSRRLIYDYLKTLGIATDEFENLELPTAVDVMKERVEFLQKLGLSIDDINEYPLMLGCSVKRNMVPVLDYLEKLGVRKSGLPDLLRRYPQVLHASVVIDLMPVIKFLRGLDIQANDIPRVLQNYPEVLGFKLEGTMSTSVAYLVAIGVNRRQIGAMLTRYPQILGTRVGRVIKPIVDYLGSRGLPNQVLARMLEESPYILGFSLEKQMKPNVECLLNFGVREHALPSLITRYPEVLGLDLKPKLTSQQYFFHFNLKVSPEDFGRILERMPQVVSLGQAPMLERVEFIRNGGFLAEDIIKMVVRCPQLLALNMDIMKLSFNYFKTEMKGSLPDLVEFPAYFTYSLETRIKPRFKRISSKGIKCSLAWFLNCSDQRFEERLDSEYIEIEEMVPSFNMDEPLESAVQGSDSEEDDEESEDEFFISTLFLCSVLYQQMVDIL